MKKQLQQGFTLIELMIVVAIIGILASIALPAYQTYVAKSNVTSVQASTAAGKTAIWQYYIENGSMPLLQTDVDGDDNLASFDSLMKSGSLAGGSKGVFTAVDAKSMSYVVTFAGINGNVNTKTATFTFTDDGDALKFECTAAGVDNKYLPKQCQA